MNKANSCYTFMSWWHSDIKENPFPLRRMLLYDKYCKRRSKSVEVNLYDEKQVKQFLTETKLFILNKSLKVVYCTHGYDPKECEVVFSLDQTDTYRWFSDDNIIESSQLIDSVPFENGIYPKVWQLAYDSGINAKKDGFLRMCNLQNPMFLTPSGSILKVYESAWNQGWDGYCE